MKSKDVIMSMLETLKVMHDMNILDTYNPTRNTSKVKKEPTYSCMCGKCKTLFSSDSVCPECGYPIMEIDPEIGYTIEAEFRVVEDSLESLGDGNE